MMLNGDFMYAIFRWGLAITLILTTGCKEPPEFVLNPSDPGTDDFLFPPGNFRVTGNTSQLTIEWTVRSANVNEFIVDRGTDIDAVSSYVTLAGYDRLWIDLNISTSYAYTYRFTARGTSALSRPAYFTTWWQTKMLYPSDDLLLPNSVPIVEIAMNSMTQNTKIIVAQENGEVSTFGTNGNTFSLDGSAAFPTPIRGVALSPGSNYAAVAADSTLSILSQNLSNLYAFRVNAIPRSPSFSATRLLAGYSDGMIRIWRTINWTFADSIMVPGGEILSCTYNPDGTVIGALSQDGSVSFLKPGDKSLLGSASVPGGKKLTIDAGGTYGAILRPDQNDVRVIRVIGGEVVVDIPGPPGVRQASFMPAGTELIIVGDDSEIVMWDVSRGVNIEVPPGLQGPYIGVAGGEFGRRFAFSRSANVISLWYAEPRWVIGK